MPSAVMLFDDPPNDPASKIANPLFQIHARVEFASGCE